MLRLRAIQRLFLAAGTCLTFMSSVSHASQFHVTVGQPRQTDGSTMIVPIHADAGVAVGAAQFELRFDPRKVRWVKCEPGSLTTGTLLESNLFGDGVVRIAFAGGDQPAGKGTLVNVTLEWLDAASGKLGIEFASVRAWDQVSALELTTSASGGDVEFTSQQPVPPESHPAEPKDEPRTVIYWAAGIIGAAIIIVLVVLFLRSRARAT